MKINYPFAAILFAMDGTLADDVPLYQQANSELSTIQFQ